MKKIVIVLIVATLSYIGYYSVVKQKNSTIIAQDPDLILFHGDGCPHCKVVLDYIKDNKIESKISISQHEVYYSKTNQNLLNETVKNCPEIDTSQGVGVPLGYDPLAKKCLYGDTPIIDWLKAKVLK